MDIASYGHGIVLALAGVLGVGLLVVYSIVRKLRRLTRRFAYLGFAAGSWAVNQLVAYYHLHGFDWHYLAGWFHGS